MMCRGDKTLLANGVGEMNTGKGRENGSHKFTRPAKKVVPDVTSCPTSARTFHVELGEVAPVPILLVSRCVTDHRS